MPPQVSVFIASYNAPKFVGLACRSILGQTFRDLELVVVDDGSEGQTRSVLRDLARRDQRLHLVEAAHRGQIETLNHAVSLCRGEYIARLDHDDVAYPHRIERQVAYLNAHPDVLAIGSLVGKIDVNGRRKATPHHTIGNRKTEPTSRPPRVLFLMGPTLMARANALKAVGGFRPKLRAAEDRDISWRLAALGRTENLPEILIDHRDHEGSLGLTECRTQTFASLISDLSAIANHFGKDDREALSLVDVGNDYVTAIRAYEELLVGLYPVKTLVLLHFAKPRFLRLNSTRGLASLCGEIAKHTLALPWDPFKMRLLMKLPRVAFYEVWGNKSWPGEKSPRSTFSARDAKPRSRL